MVSRRINEPDVGEGLRMLVNDVRMNAAKVVDPTRKFD